MTQNLLPASNWNPIGVLFGLFLVSTLYAIILEWTERQWGFVTAYTWLTVVIGVSYCLGALALLDPQAAALAGLFFAIAGIPIVIRAIIGDMRKRTELQDELERRGNGDST